MIEIHENIYFNKFIFISPAKTNSLACHIFSLFGALLIPEIYMPNIPIHKIKAEFLNQSFFIFAPGQSESIKCLPDMKLYWVTGKFAAIGFFIFFA